MPRLGTQDELVIHSAVPRKRWRLFSLSTGRASYRRPGGLCLRQDLMPHWANQEDQRKAAAASLGLSSPVRRSRRAAVSTMLAARKQARIVMVRPMRRACTGDGRSDGRVRQGCSCPCGTRSTGALHHAVSGVVRLQVWAQVFAAVRIWPGNVISSENLRNAIIALYLALLADCDLDDLDGDEGNGGNEISAQHDHPDPLAQA